MILIFRHFVHYYLNMPSSARLTPGINVTNIKQNTMASINGIDSLAMTCIGSLEMAEATFKLHPTGGVTKPTARLTVSSMPN